MENPLEEYDADLVDECSRWSQYNENLLMTLFSEGLENDSYNPFPSRRGLIYVPKHLLTLNRMKKSINSLQGIYEQLNLYEEYSETSNTTQHSLGNDVFIVHGRDDESRFKVALFVKELGLNDIMLDRQPDEGVIAILDKFEREAKKADFAIALLTPDDVGALKNEAETQLNSRPRQNVVFELGYFICALGREKVCLLIKGEIENPSDLDGMLYKRMDGDEWKLKVARDMQQAGLPVDLNDVR